MADKYQQIYDAYQKYAGYAPEKEGFDYWAKAIDEGRDIDWEAQFNLAKQNPTTVSTMDNIKKAQKLTGGTGNVFDVNALDAGQKSKVLTDAYQTYAGRRPEEEGYNYWMENFGNAFSDYTFKDQFDESFADLDSRLLNMNIRGAQDVHDYSGEAEKAFADLLAQIENKGGGSTAGGGLDGYFNTYLDHVLGTAVRELGDAAQQRRNALGASAFAAGAYGDGRHGVESAQLTDDLLTQIGDISGQIGAQGFESAMGWKNTDLDRQMAAAFQNANLQNQWINNQLAGIGLGNSMNQGNIGLGFSFADMLTGLDDYDRNWLQQQLNADYEDFWGSENWDANQLAGLLGIVSGVPGQTGSETSTPNNMWASILGSLASNPNTFKGLFK